ncbi:MAG TPA: TlpA disulfide reductase family protein [Candidatus Binatia bacterium]|nr:TlpA disulfide reductase family protein [Candidatus Binatia bacterium]
MSSPSTAPEGTPRPGRRIAIGPFGPRQLALIGLVVGLATIVLVVATRPIARLEPGGPRDPAATPYLVGPPVEGLAPGELAPELDIEGPDGAPAPLLDLDGRPVRLADLRGRGVWLNFWASWCPPCQAETPVLRDVAERYAGRGLTLVGISVQETSVDDVRAYARRYELGYVVAADLRGDVFRRYRIFALPTQIFIDPAGRIRRIVNGPVDEASAARFVEEILPSGGSGPPAASAGPTGSP